MTEPTKSERQDALQKLLESANWGDRKATLEQERADTQKMVDRLEVKFADRGLKFTQNFNGACPVQAYGYIDGERFYFRFRGNWAQLRVGPYNADYETRYADKVNRVRAERDARWAAEGRTPSLFTSREEKPQQADDRDFYPNLHSAVADLEGATPGDIYNGYLTDDEAFTMFSTLVETLAGGPEVEEDNQKQWEWLNKTD